MLYAAQVASLKNGLKRAQGELDGLRRSDAVRVRRDDEAAMLAWLGKQPDAAATQADIDATQAVLDAAVAMRERDQLLADLRSQSQLLRAALTVQRLALERGKPDAQRESGYQQRDETLIAGQLKQVQRRYAPAVEQALLADLLRQYQALPAAQHVPEFDAVFGTTPAQLKTRLDALYAGTKLGDEAERLRVMQAPACELAASSDTLLKAAATLTPALIRLEDEAKTRDGELLRLRPAYMRALIGFRQSQGRAVYPDANSTLRVSFGKVSPMDPRDGVRYRPLTTVPGIVEKHTGVAPFDAPQPLRDAIAKGDFGSTAEPSLQDADGRFPHQPRHHRRQLRLAGAGRARAPDRPQLRQQLGVGQRQLDVRSALQARDPRRRALPALADGQGVPGAAPAAGDEPAG